MKKSLFFYYIDKKRGVFFHFMYDERLGNMLKSNRLICINSFKYDIIKLTFKGEKNMIEQKKNLMTKEGLKKLTAEVEHLKTVRRKEITEKIKVALGYGDLSENSEYDEAKNDQAFNEGRISQLENTLNHAVVVDESEISTEFVTVGSIVKVMDYEFDEEVEYTIVGSTEANPMESKISNESPVGEALMGHKVDDIVEASLPNGVLAKYKVLGIRR